MKRGANLGSGPTGSYSGPCTTGQSDTGQNIRTTTYWDFIEPGVYE